MRGTLQTLGLVAGFAALAGCQDQSDTPRRGTAPASITEVVSLLDRTCGATRPGFASAADRMKANGLTIADGDYLRSPEKDLSGLIVISRSGVKTCWIAGTYNGDLITLQDDLGRRYGGLRRSDISYFGAMSVPAYDRGSKGKMLINFSGGKVGDATTRYMLGFAGK